MNLPFPQGLLARLIWLLSREGRNIGIALTTKVLFGTRRAWGSVLLVHLASRTAGWLVDDALS